MKMLIKRLDNGFITYSKIESDDDKEILVHEENGSEIDSMISLLYCINNFFGSHPGKYAPERLYISKLPGHDCEQEITDANYLTSMLEMFAEVASHIAHQAKFKPLPETSWLDTDLLVKCAKDYDKARQEREFPRPEKKAKKTSKVK